MLTPCILCIEDDRFVRDYVVASLEQWTGRGTVVLAAEDGETGLKLARERLPQLVVLDLGLPDRPALDMVKALRALPVPPKLLVHTSSDPAQFRGGPLPELIDGFVQKRFDDTTGLPGAVHALLTGQRYGTS